MAEKESFLDPVLGFKPITDDFNPNSIPSDGMEYLQHVHYEAKMCDQVVTADIDVKKFEKKRTPVFHDAPGVSVKCEKFLPSCDQQNEWIADFSEVRLTVERRRAIQCNYQSHRVDIPTIDYERGWYKFCVGDYKPVGNTVDEKGLDNEVVEKLDKECTLENDEERKMRNRTLQRIQTTEPFLHLLTAMSQVTIIAVLDYHVDWLQNNKTDFKHSGPWLYALLTCLEIPLIPETCSNIRLLARLAAECRSKLTSPDDKILPTLNLMICLVGKYFRQLDLADN